MVPEHAEVVPKRAVACVLAVTASVVGEDDYCHYRLSCYSWRIPSQLSGVFVA